MQIVHATFKRNEGNKAVSLLEEMGVDIEDYKLIESKSGDLLIINLVYGDMDVFLDGLTSKFDFENDDERSLIIFTPDTVIPRNKEKLTKASFRATRESLVTFANSKSQADLEYIMLVIFSSVITTLGLILDNVAVIVGGMVIAPVLGPIIAISIGIVLGKSKLIKQGLLAEVVAITIAVGTGAIFGLIIPNVELNNSLLIRMRPTLADVLIALSAGAAGAYVLIKGNLKSGLVGVMVAASLLPVMATIGLGVTMPESTMLGGSILLLAGNYLALILSTIGIFYLEGLKPQVWYKHKADKIVKKSLSLIVVSVIVLSIPLGSLTLYQFYYEKPGEIITKTINSNLFDINYRIERIEVDENNIDITIFSDTLLAEEKLRNIKKNLNVKLTKKYNINFNIVKAKRYSY
ncbi:MAG: TIGR00341 family protein [Firmicutes bacterium]|nr:TIGR00341 family protein [Bacillota bacterium]